MGSECEGHARARGKDQKGSSKRSRHEAIEAGQFDARGSNAVTRRGEPVGAPSSSPLA